MADIFDAKYKAVKAAYNDLCKDLESSRERGKLINNAINKMFNAIDKTLMPMVEAQEKKDALDSLIEAETVKLNTLIAAKFRETEGLNKKTLKERKNKGIEKLALIRFMPNFFKNLCHEVAKLIRTIKGTATIADEIEKAADRVVADIAKSHLKIKTGSIARTKQVVSRVVTKVVTSMTRLVTRKPSTNSQHSR